MGEHLYFDLNFLCMAERNALFYQFIDFFYFYTRKRKKAYEFLNKNTVFKKSSEQNKNCKLGLKYRAGLKFHPQKYLFKFDGS